MNPAALTVEQVAELVSAYDGEPCTADEVRARIAAGMPVNEDGTVNLMHSLAWMLRELTGGV